MKAKVLHLMTLLWCLHSSLGFSQTYTPKYIIGPSEYNCYFIPTASHHAYDVAGGLPTLIPNQPAVVTQIAGSLHHACLLDNAGNCYCWGDNSNGQIGNGATSVTPVPAMYKVAVDSMGSPFANIVQIMPGGSSYGYSTAALKADGTVWIWGATGGGNRGNGQAGGINTRPVQVNFPAGVFITKIQINVLCIALDANGNVWTWGANTGYVAPYLLAQGTYTPDPTVPHKIALPSPAKDITGSNLWNYALLTNGSLYGWAFYSAYLGIGTTGFAAEAPAKIVPQLLDGQLGLPHPISSVIVSSAATYVILSDSTIWAWGDNAVGAIGNGKELDFSKYTTSPSPSGGTLNPYNWDWGPGELLQQKPVQIAKGLHSFTNIWTSGADVFYCYAEDVNGNLYSWGRNKGSVIGNGAVAPGLGAIGAAYANSWDVPWVTAVDPFALTKTALTSSPYCTLNPSSSPCNGYSIPVTAAPVVNAGPNQNITTSSTMLNGSVTTGSGSTSINYYLWTQVSGPNTPLIILNTGPVAKLTGLVTGTYVFQLKATDNNWRSNSSTVTIIVNASGNKKPVAITGAKKTITLPNDTATLDGSASVDSDGVVSAYAWSQISGPSTAIVTNPSGAVTTVGGLLQGTYVFFLTVTDNLGATGTAYDTVIVNPALSQPPTVSAGSNQTISLPANTVNLTGTATGNNGATISSTSWTQTLGATATIATPTALGTTITGLTAGIYSFTLSATDNNGLSNSAIVTVIVNATASAPPTVSAGSNQIITLPANTATLTGTATGNGGATISATYWIETSGPNAATLGSASSLSTGASGLIQGVYTFQLSATDNNGLADAATITVTVNSANTPPVVSAGSNQTITLPVSSATLTGIAAGTNGATISTTAWTQTSGPNTATITSISGLSTTVTGLAAGIYSFTLSATDNNGLSNSAIVTVIVNATASVPPTVSAGSNQTITLPANSVTLSGTATGNGGATISSTTWSQTSGPNTATLGSASSLSTGASGLVQGVYTFQLSATDNNSLSDASTVTITVKVANTPPVVSAGGNQAITLPVSTVNLSGAASGSGGATLSTTTWTQLTGPNISAIAAPSSISTGVSGLIQGVYTFQLSAVDNNGLSGASTVTVTVNPAVPPSVNAGIDQTIMLPASSVTLSGTATGNNGATISQTTWTQTAGPNTAVIAVAASLNTAVTGLVAGDYIFKLSATDNNGITVASTMTVTVDASPPNQPPIADAGPDQLINLPTSTVDLNGGSSYDPDGTIVSYNWIQVSGAGGVTITNSNSSTPVMNGLQAGIYIFQLTVTDNQGAIGQSEVTIDVQEVVIGPPVADAGRDTTIALPATAAMLNGSSSSDAGGTIMSYQWAQVSGPVNATITSPDFAVTSAENLQPGDYVFRLTVANSQGDTSSALVKVVVVDNLRASSSDQLFLYPNPATDIVRLRITGSGTSGLAIVNIYDMNGRLVDRSSIIRQAGYSETPIDVSNLGPGTYLVEVSIGGSKSLVIKLIKQ